jgi:hypothetical protein
MSVSKRFLKKVYVEVSTSICYRLFGPLAQPSGQPIADSGNKVRNLLAPMQIFLDKKQTNLRLMFCKGIISIFEAIVEVWVAESTERCGGKIRLCQKLFVILHVLRIARYHDDNNSTILSNRASEFCRNSQT